MSFPSTAFERGFFAACHVICGFAAMGIGFLMIADEIDEQRDKAKADKFWQQFRYGKTTVVEMPKEEEEIPLTKNSDKAPEQAKEDAACPCEQQSELKGILRL